MILLVLVICGVASQANTIYAQIDEICGEVGVMPSLDSPFAHIPYVYGRVTLKGFDASKTPKVVVIFSEGSSVRRWMVGRTGNYCFRRGGATGALVIEIDGTEAARRTLPSFGGPQQREDFEVQAGGWQRGTAPGVVSMKFDRPPNEKTRDLYQQVAEAAAAGDINKTITLLKEIIRLDAEDFIAWAQLGAAHLDQKAYVEAEAAIRRSLGHQPEFTPAWIVAGRIRLVNKQPEAAIEVFKYVTELEPKFARGYYLLGESYLQAKQGTLAVAALDKALELAPQEMADAHLLKALLYDLAGAKKLAAAEYKAFLAKAPNYTEKAKLEKYIKNHAQ